MSNTHLIIGANNELGRAYCREIAGERLGAKFILVGDDARALRGVANDLRARNMRSVSTMVVDYTDTDVAQQMLRDKAIREATDIFIDCPTIQFSAERGEKGFMKQQLQQNAIQPISIIQRLLAGCPSLKNFIVGMKPGAETSVDTNVQITNRSMISAFIATNQKAYRRKGVFLIDVDWRLSRHEALSDIQKFDADWASSAWIASRMRQATKKPKAMVQIPAAGEFRRAHTSAILKQARIDLNAWFDGVVASAKAKLPSSQKPAHH